MVAPALEELIEADLIEPSVIGERGVAARGPSARLGTITRLCLSAIGSGVAVGLLRELDEDSFEARQFSYAGRPPHFLEQHLRIALLVGQYDQYADLTVANELFLWLLEPAAEPYLKILPDAHRHQACEIGLRYLIGTVQNTTVFAKTCAKFSPNNSTLHVVNAFAHALRGEIRKGSILLNQVFELNDIKKTDLVEAYSVQALIHTVTGDNEAALQSIKIALETEKKGTRKKILYPANTAFSIATMALPRCNSTEADQLFSNLLEARKKLKMESYFDDLFTIAQRARLPHTRIQPFYLPGPPSLGSALYTIASRWHKDYHWSIDNSHSIARIENLLYTTNNNGYKWLAAELQAVLEAMFENYDALHEDTQEQLNKSSAEQRHKKLKTKSLLTLVKTEAVWEFQLRILEQLAPKKLIKKKAIESITEKKRRLIWIVDSHLPLEVNTQPIEQALGKNGNWSAGRKVALKRLKEESGKMQHLLEQDIKAASTIVKYSYGWNGTTSYETNNRTVYQLVGHPHVYGQDGKRISVQESPAHLSVHKNNEDFIVTVQPLCNQHDYVAILDEVHSTIMVTHFNAAQRRIRDSLPPDGLVLPAESEARLQSVLSSLSDVLTVQADTSVAGSSVESGDFAPLLELDLVGTELWVRVRVEPLAHSKTYFDAGEGGATVYVQTPEGSIPVQRDLKKEYDEMQLLIANSPVLSRFFDGHNAFFVQGLENALELISDVQKNSVRCLWPKDVAYSVETKVDASQLQIKISSADKWFTATGELRYSDNDALSLIDILTRLADSPESRFIELDKGKYLALSRSLHKQLNALRAFSVKSEKKSKDIKLHPTAMFALDPLFSNTITKTDKRATKLRAQIETVFANPVTVPGNLQADLRSYQVDGFEWLTRLATVGAGACLADDMGLGKTVQALAVLLARAEHGPALVVAPTSVIGNWVNEAQRFAPSLNVSVYGASANIRKETLSKLNKFDLVIISYGLMANDNELLQAVHWASVILDEAQAIKNANTQRARAAKDLVADFRMVTTGTPIQNNLMDLHSLFGFTNPGLLGSETAFRKNFALPIARDNNLSARTQLQQLVSPFMLRRHKRDVLQELPARTDINLSVSLSGPEAALYESIREEALVALQTAAQDNNQSQVRFKVLSYLTKLRRLCCNPKLIASDWTGPESKLELCIETLQELLSNGHKALVFSQFVDHLKIVEERLKTIGVEYQYLDGSTPAKKRTERVNAFQAGQGDVFLISLTAGGTGLNLTAADYVVHLDPWWNPAVEDQASDRAHRLGQKRPVTIYRMVTTGTIEEQIQTLHTTKRDLADSVLAGSDSSTVNTDDLMALLQQSAG